MLMTSVDRSELESVISGLRVQLADAESKLSTWHGPESWASAMDKIARVEREADQLRADNEGLTRELRFEKQLHDSLAAIAEDDEARAERAEAALTSAGRVALEAAADLLQERMNHWVETEDVHCPELDCPDYFTAVRLLDVQDVLAELRARARVVRADPTTEDQT